MSWLRTRELLNKEGQIHSANQKDWISEWQGLCLCLSVWWEIGELQWPKQGHYAAMIRLSSKHQRRGSIFGYVVAVNWIHIPQGLHAFVCVHVRLCAHECDCVSVQLCVRMWEFGESRALTYWSDFVTFCKGLHRLQVVIKLFVSSFPELFIEWYYSR